MSNTILIGRNRVSESEIASIPRVAFTDTFSPIHHIDVISAIRAGVEAMGLEIRKSEYCVAQEGMRMFAVWDLFAGNSEMCWSIGIRNSMNKSLSLGITAGSRVFVCENLAFSGEFVEFRRHTSGLDLDEMEFLAFRSMKKMVGMLTKFQHWHESLRDYQLTTMDAKLLLIEVLAQQVIPASKFHNFNDLYSRKYDNTLYGFHESVTDVLRGSNLLTLPKKNAVLNTILDGHIHRPETFIPHQLGDFFEARSLIHR